jgi:transcriptional regulator
MRRMLTEKELEVLRRRSRGESQREIARALKISQAAVSKFETNAHRKLLEAEQVLTISKELGLSVEHGQLQNRINYKRRGGGA